MRRPVRVGALGVAALAVAFAALECARPAPSGPLQVTYYYLPG